MIGNHCFGIAWDESFWAMVQMGVEVERDDDYLRALLQEFEGSNSWAHASMITFGAGADEAKRHFHVLLLVDAGLMAPMAPDAYTYRITNAGHDFLAMTRQSATWEATKAAAKNMRGASIQMLYRIAEGYARQKLAEIGVPLA